MVKNHIEQMSNLHTASSQTANLQTANLRANIQRALGGQIPPHISKIIADLQSLRINQTIPEKYEAEFRKNFSINDFADTDVPLRFNNFENGQVFTQSVAILFWLQTLYYHDGSNVAEFDNIRAFDLFINYVEALAMRVDPQANSFFDLYFAYLEHVLMPMSNLLYAKYDLTNYTRFVNNMRNPFSMITVLLLDLPKFMGNLRDVTMLNCIIYNGLYSAIHHMLGLIGSSKIVVGDDLALSGGQENEDAELRARYADRDKFIARTSAYVGGLVKSARLFDLNEIQALLLSCGV